MNKRITSLFAITLAGIMIVGCGGSGGGGFTGTTTSAVTGTVVDAPVNGASIRFFTSASGARNATRRTAGSAAQTDEVKASQEESGSGFVQTDATGDYSATFTGDLATIFANGIFTRSFGGTTTRNGQTVTAPDLFGASPAPTGQTSLTAATCSPTPIGALIISAMTDTTNEPSATIEEAYAVVRTAFPQLPASVDSINQDGDKFDAATNNVIETIADALGTSQGGDANIADSAASDGTNAKLLNLLDTLIQTGTQTDITNAGTTNNVTVATPTRYFAVNSLTVGGQSLTVPSAVSGDPKTATFGNPSNAIDIAGTTELPTITLSASNAQNGFAAGTVFANATLGITIDATSTSDPRVMNFTVNKARATVNSGGTVTFGIDEGATFTLSGTDSAGQSVATIIASNQAADGNIATTSNNTFSFDTDTLVNRMRTRLASNTTSSASFISTHPAFTIASAGTYSITLTVSGIPFGLTATTNGFSKLNVASVTITGQHTFPDGG